jgi:hypothetical protein
MYTAPSPVAATSRLPSGVNSSLTHTCENGGGEKATEKKRRNKPPGVIGVRSGIDLPENVARPAQIRHDHPILEATFDAREHARVKLSF